MAKNTRLFRRIYSPVKHAVMATKESVGAVTNTAKGVACEGLSGLNRVGRSVTTHANMAVNELLGKRTRRRRGSKRTTRKHKGGRR
jgi:hypothetical protein